MKKVNIFMFILMLGFIAGSIYLLNETLFLEQTLAKKTQEATEWENKYHYIDSVYKAGQQGNTVWYKADPKYMGNDD